MLVLLCNWYITLSSGVFSNEFAPKSWHGLQIKNTELLFEEQKSSQTHFTQMREL